MMYECDYCSKQFRDTPAARRRHLQGVGHQRAKALWYYTCLPRSQIDDPHCTGSYYHPNKDVQQLNAQGGAGTNIIDSQRITANSQLALAPFGDIFGHHMGSSMGNLPPSLRPPPEGGYPPLAFIDWG